MRTQPGEVIRIMHHMQDLTFVIAWERDHSFTILWKTSKAAKFRVLSAHFPSLGLALAEAQAAFELALKNRREL